MNPFHHKLVEENLQLDRLGKIVKLLFSDYPNSINKCIIGVLNVPCFDVLVSQLTFEAVKTQGIFICQNENQCIYSKMHNALVMVM